MLSMLLFAASVCIGDDDCDHDEDSHDHEEDYDDVSSERIRDAFLLSLFAGLSTTLGAALTFCMKKNNIQKENSTFLAACLSFAAAVMVYVSLIELWPAALSQFEEETTEQLAHIYTSISFFGGMLLGSAASKTVRFFDEVRIQRKSVKLKANYDMKVEMQTTAGIAGESQLSFRTDDSKDTEEDAEVILMSSETNLSQTGIVVAISIALHNFPEGLATFIATVVDFKVGVATAFAIAMHNIPEGISISIPYYYASESRWKAFALAFLSGIAEPIGALVGWGILGGVWGNTVFGTMFGLTAGIMVYISFSELLPLARKNDLKQKVTTISIFMGMIVMDISLFATSGYHSHSH